MRILLLTQLFHPEPNLLKGLEFAKALLAKGHEVIVLTGFPNYPQGKIYPGYKLKIKQVETIEGVRIVRVPFYLDHTRSGIRRALSYISAAVVLTIAAILLKSKPDLVHVYQGPSTLAFPAMVMRWIKGVPYVLDVQDIWPESVIDSGMLSFPGFRRILDAWCSMTYKQAVRIIALSEGYKHLMVERGVPREKVAVIYNWCDTRQERAMTTPTTGDPFGLQGRFNVVYAGNMGTLQGLEVVLRAAALTQRDHGQIRFVLVGDGITLNKLKQLAESEDLDNILFLGRLPVEELTYVLSQASALLIHLKDTPLSRVGIPSKTQASLLAGRPILIGVNGEASDLVKKANAGFAFYPEDGRSLANFAVQLQALSTFELQQLGNNGKKFYFENLSFERGVNQMASVFSSAVGAGSSTGRSV